MADHADRKTWASAPAAAAAPVAARPSSGQRPLPWAVVGAIVLAEVAWLAALVWVLIRLVF